MSTDASSGEAPTAATGTDPMALPEDFDDLDHDETGATPFDPGTSGESDSDRSDAPARCDECGEPVTAGMFARCAECEDARGLATDRPVSDVADDLQSPREEALVEERRDVHESAIEERMIADSSTPKPRPKLPALIRRRCTTRPASSDDGAGHRRQCCRGQHRW